MAKMIVVKFHGEIGGEASTFSAFQCQEPGCSRYYNLIHGYFGIKAEKISRQDSQRHCRHEGAPMYLSTGPEGDGLVTYRCAQLGCDGTDRGPNLACR